MPPFPMVSIGAVAALGLILFVLRSSSWDEPVEIGKALAAARRGDFATASATLGNLEAEVARHSSADYRHFVLERIEGDDTVWEQGPLPQLAQEGQLMSFTHGGFWHPMDTLRDKRTLEGLWHDGKAPWKLWHD